MSERWLKWTDFEFDLDTCGCGLRKGDLFEALLSSSTPSDLSVIAVAVAADEPFAAAFFAATTAVDLSVKVVAAEMIILFPFFFELGIGN